MKIKRTAKKAVLPKSQLAPEEIDKLADDYNRAKENETRFSKQASQSSEQIKSLAAQFGARSGKRLLLKGSKFVVGYTESDSKPIFDEAKALRVVPKEVLRKCSVTSIDPNKLAQQVELGKFSAKLFATLFTKPSKPTLRLYVTSRQAFDKGLQDEN